MKNLVLFLVGILIFICFPTRLLAQDSVIREESWDIKTYPFSDPNPVPILVGNPEIYPYFSFDGFSDTATEQNWKVVRLENDYLQVFVMPEVGGKVYGAIEKSTGKEFIYLNEVLKFRRIAMRGPWTSGGIEFNFGLVGHAPTVATPVDYVLRENDDGSVSCIVGTMDLASRTRWYVEIRLPKDRAYFETRSTWYNPTLFDQSYYNWSTAAVSGHDDLQYFFPGRSVMPHNTLVDPDSWPIDRQGRNLSWYKNNAFGGSKSHFVLGHYDHHFGGYWHDLDFGFGHWARYNEVPGQKVWIWALSRQGAIWEDLLTDTDGQYSEPQAGRLFNQSDHTLFAPYTGDTWTELWFPFKDIGGMVDASSYGVLNVERQEKSIYVGVNALQSLNEELTVRLGDDTLFRENIVLAPMESWQADLPSTDRGRLEVTVGNKLFYGENPAQNVLLRPIGYAGIDTSMTEERYRAAQHHEKQRRHNQAIEEYLIVLGQEPYHLRALTRLAALYGRRGEYSEGLSFAARVLERDMYDPATNYVYGILARRSGRLLDAKETLGWAARSMEYRSNALTQIAEIYVQENNMEWALDYVKRALEYDSHNIRAYEILALVYRKLDLRTDAGLVLAQLEDQDPLNHLIRFERYLLEPDEEKKQAFLDLIRNEFPHETFLELAVFYHTMNLDDEAIRVLRMAPTHPTVIYWLAYLLRQVRPAESQAYLSRANECSPLYVFPFREESIPVLKWAIGERSNDWKARYYLGLIYWGKGRIDEATLLFDSCGEPEFAPFYLARAQLGRNMDADTVLSYYQKAVELNPEEWRNWHYLVTQLSEMGRGEEALAAAEKAFKAFPDQVVSVMDYAGKLFDAGYYEDALELLEKTNVLPYEGSWEAHDLVMRTQVYLAMKYMRSGEFEKALPHLAGARTYPEHLGTGMPYEPDFRLQDYLESLCYDRLNDPDRAEALRQQIITYSNSHLNEVKLYPYFGALALRDSGDPDKARRMLQDLERSFPQNQLVQWSAAMFTGDQTRIRQMKERLRRDARYRMQIDAAEMIEKE